VPVLSVTIPDIEWLLCPVRGIIERNKRNTVRWSCFIFLIFQHISGEPGGAEKNNYSFPTPALPGSGSRV
jgi:hypothetical protein